VEFRVGFSFHATQVPVTVALVGTCTASERRARKSVGSAALPRTHRSISCGAVPHEVETNRRINEDDGHGLIVARGTKSDNG